ncbi:MAG: hypothetical protein ACQERC_04755 [Bacteroidota bacterium]
MNWIKKQEEWFEEARFGAMTLMITFQSCLGSVAAMYALKLDNVLILAIVAALTMASNAMFIAQAEAKYCLYAFYTSIVVNTLLLITTLILL